MSWQRYEPDRHHRQSLRLPKHDYTWTGAYFVTIRAKQHEPVFDVPELRAIVTETWQALPQRFPSVTLDEYMVMPDHIHFILWLDVTKVNPPTLGSVVGAYKSLTTVAWIRHIKAANIQWSGPLWQENYYERCIREPGELETTRQYIRDNPTRRKAKSEGEEDSR